MRLDRLTTKFQEALADAQSLAVGKDNPTVEPAHVLLAMLKQGEGSVRGVISKAGGNPQVLVKGVEAEVNNLPQVANNAGQIQIGSKLQAALNLTDKEAQKRGDQFIASELFLLACLQDSTGLAKVMKEAGLNAQSLNTAIEQVRGGAAVDSADGESQREALKKYT
ncbi:Clp protease N-terminal domain-containing protein, partial [Limnobacter sp. UBA1615]